VRSRLAPHPGMARVFYMNKRLRRSRQNDGEPQAHPRRHSGAIQHYLTKDSSRRMLSCSLALALSDCAAESRVEECKQRMVDGRRKFRASPTGIPDLLAHRPQLRIPRLRFRNPHRMTPRCSTVPLSRSSPSLPSPGSLHLPILASATLPGFICTRWCWDIFGSIASRI
jgi:hypothetical protein